MNWTEYKQWVSARCNLKHTLTVEGCKLALEGEQHEFNAAWSTLAALGIDVQKREMDGRQQKPERLHKACSDLALEASDVLFYIARLCVLEDKEGPDLPGFLQDFMKQGGISLETLIRVNVEKLTERDAEQKQHVFICPSCSSPARKLFMTAEAAECESCRSI